MALITLVLLAQLLFAEAARLRRLGRDLAAQWMKL